jgi:hypothetical protein
LSTTIIDEVAHGSLAKSFIASSKKGKSRAEEYRQIVAYHYRMARHHLVKAQTYREHAKMRYGLQLPLFSEDEGAVSGKGEV